MKRRWAAVAVGLTMAVGAADAPGAYSPRVEVQPDGTAHLGWLDGLPLVAERSWSAAGALTEAQAVSWARGEMGQLEMAADASGAATFVWMRYGERRVIEARRRAPDGSLGPVLPVSSPLAEAGDPDIAVRPGGGAVIVWRRDGNPSSYVEARRVSPGGALGPILALSGDGYRVSEPQVAVDPAGNALATWIRTDAAAGTDVVRSRPIGADGALGTPQTLSAGTPAIDSPRVAFDANGNALAAWLRKADGVYVPQIRRRAANGSLSAVQSLTAGGTPAAAATLRLAVHSSGSAFLAWTRLLEGFRPVVQARYRAANGTLGSVIAVSGTAADARADGPDVAMDADGNGIVVWEHGTSSEPPREIRARRRSAAGTVGPAQVIAGSTAGILSRRFPKVGMGADGAATIAWAEYGNHGRDGEPNSEYVMARRHRPGGALSPLLWVDGP